MNPDELLKIIGDEKVAGAVEKATAMIEKQMLDPDVFGATTLEALTRASALAAYFKHKAVEMRIVGRKDASSYLESLGKSLDYIISDLKYKINANTK
jgi:hypothetical protein